MRGNVMDLAVGIIIGAAFTAVVTSLVKDLFTPVLGLLIGGVDFSNWFATLKGPHENSLSAAQAAGATTLNIGLFLNAFISFVIVSFAVFWVEGAQPLQGEGGGEDGRAHQDGGDADRDSRSAREPAIRDAHVLNLRPELANAGSGPAGTASSAGDQLQPGRQMKGAHQQVHRDHSAQR
jgi:large conductance mechanosensitive channel protein